MYNTFFCESIKLTKVITIILYDCITFLHTWIWSLPLLLFLVGVGVYLTIALKGLQIRYLWIALRSVFIPPKNSSVNSKGDISHFQSLMTSLASIIGIGNIAGVATAVMAGGLGSLFWMWVMALFGMATTYAESLLAVKYRSSDSKGEMSGGPMYYMKKGLGAKKLAIFYAIGGVLASIVTGNMAQSNSMADACSDLFNIGPWSSGIILSILIGIMIIGGIKSIGKVAGLLVPVMASFYIVGGGAIIVLNIDKLPGALSMIVSSAFTGQAAVGGFIGSSMMMAMRMGITRGLFSGESGLGSTSIAAAAAKTDHPGRQALLSMTGVFLSTLVLCTITGLILAITGVVGQLDASGKVINGLPLAVRAFNTVFPFGGTIVNIGALLFGYSTILSWSYSGEKCWEFIFGTSYVMVFRLLYTFFTMLGCGLDIAIVWTIADIANGIMAVPNLIAILALTPIILSETKAFIAILSKEKAERSKKKTTK